MVITATGYYATGSSAVYDLLKEYSSCTAGKFQNINAEHLLLYMPNGLFDLEDKLLIGNSIHRSDEALNSFYEQMYSLYVNNFIWFGNYKKLLGPHFIEAVNIFIDELTEFKTEAKWYYDYEMVFSVKHILANIRNIVLHRGISANFAQTIKYRKKSITRYSYVSNSTFYKSAKKFINSYLEMITDDDEKNLVLDHFLLPHNLFRIENYFSEDEIKVIIVERDPRDVYVNMMKKWADFKIKPMIPYEIEEYIKFWIGLRKCERQESSKSVLRINFEDMLYKYDETIGMIEIFCGLKENEHINKAMYFNPKKSIKNTQMFLSDTRWQKEIKIIENKLNKYLYPFPR